MSPAVKNARTALDKAQAETKRISDAVEVHSERLEGLRAGLTQPPDRSAELGELLAAQALGEATEKDVATLRAIIAKEAESANKRNSADHQRIDELQQQLSGLELRRVKAEASEQAARKALHDAIVAEFQADAEQHSKELVKALHAASAAYEKLAAALVALDSTDGVGRENTLARVCEIRLDGDWPMPGPSYEELFVLNTGEARKRAFQRYAATVEELAGAGVDIRELRS